MIKLFIYNILYINIGIIINDIYLCIIKIKIIYLYKIL
jgi:hypothetical protein